MTAFIREARLVRLTSEAGYNEQLELTTSRASKICYTIGHLVIPAAISSYQSQIRSNDNIGFI